ncbi:MAG: Holliday junction resolvase RuvX [Bacteroidetes bacterium]|nr:Holliday junction resolvase RuvX [Bacteroidota bacterium]MBU1423694.1 Holliday junction resolvase RuvX [Bacteroidota bacterium]
MKRILGIDYGSKRIGVAISDPLRIIAQGIEVISNTPAFFDKIKMIAEKYDVEAIVVGFPYNLKGETGQSAKEVQVFIQGLKAVINIPIIEWDERFTSAVAHQTLIDMGVKRKKRQQKSTIDRMAAALILQSYLDSVVKSSLH